MKRYKDQNGNIAKQISEITTTIADWNNDGDVYPKEGIWIEWENFGSKDFLSISELSYLEPLD